MQAENAALPTRSGMLQHLDAAESSEDVAFRYRLIREQSHYCENIAQLILLQLLPVLGSRELEDSFAVTN